jgi:hypothetical protein
VINIRSDIELHREETIEIRVWDARQVFMGFVCANGFVQRNYANYSFVVGDWVIDLRDGHVNYGRGTCLIERNDFLTIDSSRLPNTISVTYLQTE